MKSSCVMCLIRVYVLPLFLLFSIIAFETNAFTPTTRSFPLSIIHNHSTHNKEKNRLFQSETNVESIVEKVISEQWHEQEEHGVLQQVADPNTEYTQGFLAVLFLCFLYSTVSPLWHFASLGTSPIPPLFLNAANACVALVGLLAFGPVLEAKLPPPPVVTEKSVMELETYIHDHHDDSVDELPTSVLESAVSALPHTVTEAIVETADDLQEIVLTELEVVETALEPAFDTVTEVAEVVEHAVTEVVENMMDHLPDAMHIETKTTSAVVATPRVSNNDSPVDSTPWGGLELGLWRFLGASAHVYGLSMTSAGHGAFLTQLSTLIVPVIQGMRGETIPQRVQVAVAMALAGVFCLTQDAGAAATAVSPLNQWQGDVACIVAALCYSIYDIQTYKWAKLIPRQELVISKIATQAFLSVILCATVSWSDVSVYLEQNDVFANGSTLIPIVLYSGLVINGFATYLQVNAMNAVGPTRAQTVFASTPLWSAFLAYLFLGETIGVQGAIGAMAFLGALALAATTPKEN